MKYLGHENASGPYPVAVGFCVSRKGWDKARQDMGCPPDVFPDHVGCASGFRQPNGAMRVIVSFTPAFKDLTLACKMGVIAHESVHVWQFFMDTIAEKEPGWEIEACAIQWVTQWLIECLQDKGWMK